MAMKKLHTFGLYEGPLAELFRERLADEGVDSIVRNQQLSSALGEIPFTECFPELWVIDAETWPRARKLLDQWFTESSMKEPWTCPECREVVEPPLACCWRCGHDHDESV